MKFCGCKETCFENGDAPWGHLGGVMCLHLGEENYFNGEIKGFCSKTDEFVETYSTEEEYKNLKSGHKNL